MQGFYLKGVVIYAKNGNVEPIYYRIRKTCKQAHSAGSKKASIVIPALFLTEANAILEPHTPTKIVQGVFQAMETYRQRNL